MAESGESQPIMAPATPGDSDNVIVLDGDRTSKTWAQLNQSLYFHKFQTDHQATIEVDVKGTGLSSPEVQPRKVRFFCCGSKVGKCNSVGWSSWNATYRTDHVRKCPGLRAYVIQQVKQNNHAPATAVARMHGCGIDSRTGLPDVYITPLARGQQTLTQMRQKAEATDAQKQQFREAVARLVMSNPSLSYNWATSSAEFWRFCDTIMRLDFSLYSEHQRARLNDPLCVIERPPAMCAANTLSSEKMVKGVVNGVQSDVRKLFAALYEAGSAYVTLCCDGWQDVSKRFMLVYSIVTHDFEIFCATRDTKFEKEQQSTLSAHLNEVIKIAKELIGDMRIGAICTDNATNMIKMAAVACAVNEDLVHYGCGAHTFDLFPKQLAQESKPSSDGSSGDIGASVIRDVLARVAQIIGYIHNSKGAIHCFRKNLSSSGVNYQWFIALSDTRWSIAFFALRRFVELRATVEDFFSLYGRKIRDAHARQKFDAVEAAFRADADLFLKAELIRDLFEPFQRATSYLESMDATLASQFVLARTVKLDIDDWLRRVRRLGHPWAQGLAEFVENEWNKRNGVMFEGKSKMKPFFTHIHVAAYMLTVPRVLNVRDDFSLEPDVVELPEVGSEVHDKAIELITKKCKHAIEAAGKQWKTDYPSVIQQLLLAIAEKARLERESIVQAIKAKDAERTSAISTLHTGNAIEELKQAHIQAMNTLFWRNDGLAKLSNEANLDKADVKLLWMCLRRFAAQLAEVVPHSASVERLNSIQQRVQSKDRNRMRATRVNQEMFVAVNTRRLQTARTKLQRQTKSTEPGANAPADDAEVDDNEGDWSPEEFAVLEAFFDDDDSLVQQAKAAREDEEALHASSDDEDVDYILNGAREREPAPAQEEPPTKKRRMGSLI